MKFNLIDQIESISAQRIVVRKQVSLAEEYLADHFPTFPVLPGVLMLEAMTQAGAWLLHTRHNFACSMAVLREVRNVRYGRFVAPGDVLRIEVELTRELPDGGLFKAAGTVGDAQAVSARLELAYFNLAEREPALADIDARLREHNRRRWGLLRPPPASATVLASAKSQDTGS